MALAYSANRCLGAMSKKKLPDIDLAFLPSALQLKRRKDWTRQVPKPWILKPSGDFDRITVHHTAAESHSKTDQAVIAEIESVCLAHITRGYGDIGYHFVIDARGVVWEARSLAYEGAHVKEQNNENIGVVLLGNFEVQDVNDAQKESLAVLVAALRKKYQVKRHRVYGHRDLGKSVCPGANLYKFVEHLREAQISAEKGGK